MLTLWKAVSICLTSGKKKTNKYAMLHHESNQHFLFQRDEWKSKCNTYWRSFCHITQFRAFTRLQLVFGTIPSQFWTEI